MEDKIGFTGCTHERKVENGKCADCGNEIKEEQRTCDRCGSINEVRLHYWASPSVFDDYIFWPKNWLCERCREFWSWYMVPKVEKAETKTYKKSDVRKSLGKHGSFEFMMLDIPSIEQCEAEKIEDFLLCCHDEFNTPSLAYKSDGWKVLGQYETNGVIRAFVLRPFEKKEQPNYDELKI